MSDQQNNDDGSESEAIESPDLTRRKVLYVAPAIMSAKLFNTLAGCGKVNPTTRECSVVAMQS